MNQLDSGAQAANPTLDRAGLPALPANTNPTLAISKARQANDSESRARSSGAVAREAWQRWLYKLIYQSFLLSQQLWHSATTGVDGLVRRNERSLSFTTRQVLTFSRRRCGSGYLDTYEMWRQSSK